MTDRHSVVYIATCATLAATDIGKLVGLADRAGWQACLMVTPQALNFIDRDTLEQQTGYPVRHEYKLPGTPSVFPPADGIIVAGASFNTLNKWATGITDNLVLGTVTEAIGLNIPIVLMPFVPAAYAVHPVWSGNLETLQQMGVTVVPYEPHQPGTAQQRVLTYPWELLWKVFEDRISAQRKVGQLP